MEAPESLLDKLRGLPEEELGKLPPVLRGIVQDRPGENPPFRAFNSSI